MNFYILVRRTMFFSVYMDSITLNHDVNQQVCIVKHFEFFINIIIKRLGYVGNL